MKKGWKLHPRGANRATTPTLIRSPRSAALPRILPWLTLALMCETALNFTHQIPIRPPLIFILLQQDLRAGEDGRAEEIKWNLQELWIWHQTGALERAPIGFCSAWISSVNQLLLWVWSLGGEKWGIKMALEQLLGASYCFNTLFFFFSLFIQTQTDINMQIKLHKLAQNSFEIPHLLDCKARF